MKKVVNIVLLLCVCGLAYICVGSIMGSINFGKEREAREKQIIARLIDIRTAQVAFRDLNKGQYTDSFDELISFVKNDSLPFVRKVGELSDKQLEDGLTESKAMKLIDDARSTNDQAVRTELYEKAMEEILDLAIELPVYQRSVLYAFNSNVIKAESLPTASEMNPYSSPLDRIWEIEFAE